MGKFMRKCKEIGEVAVLEVGVQTRARALAMAAAASAAGVTKRRRPTSTELQFLHLGNLHEAVISPGKSISPAVSDNSGTSRCLSSNSDRLPVVSRCSSNGSSERLRSCVDLEESFGFENSMDRKESRRETTPSSDLQAESTARPLMAASRPKMPTEAEIDEFFSVAEKVEKKRFTEKYNYDIVKDVPLEGRYEWVRLKQ